MNEYVADFETTTTNPNDCRVWAYGIAEIGNIGNFIYGTNINDFMSWCMHANNPIVYFHNLKFDSSFILNWLFQHGFHHAKTKKDVSHETFTTLISDTGQFYQVKVIFRKFQTKSITVTFKDSLKIIPLKVADIPKAYNIPLEKLEIEYDGDIPIGYQPSEKEIEYLKNDCIIVAKAIEIQHQQNLKRLTAGSNALNDFVLSFGKKNIERYFPKIPLEYDQEIRQSYKGGYTYVNDKFKSKDIGQGIVLDVNSLYPSVMYSCPMPYGEPVFFRGKYQKDKHYPLYIQCFKCCFELKPNYIPTVQIKGGIFVETEYLKDSGHEPVTLCMTSVDFEIFKTHYNYWDEEYIGGWKFMSYTGFFHNYIDKWIKIKNEATISGNTGMRTIAKLMLNSLYGKFATNPVAKSKWPYYENGIVKFSYSPPENRETLYIPVGTFITAWARYKTITGAQSVYERFLYCDTDSLHLIGTEIPKNLEIDNIKIGAWKHECTFTRARFLRAKTYIEEINGNLKVTCAGLPQKCHDQVTWENFHEGKEYLGKLMPKQVHGGIILKESSFKIKG